MVNALLLDLDGTLLDIDFRNFMGEYLAGTASRFADHMPEETFQQQLLASTGAMLFNDDPNKTVLEAFLHDFGKNAPLPPDAMERFEAYYEQDFPKLRKWGRPVPGARDLVDAALAKDLIVVVATAPLFPEIAIRERLRWAGLDGMPFRLLTTSEKMRRSKPTPAYYEEIARYIDVPPERCYMVGDEAIMDGAAIVTGMSVVFVGPEKPSNSEHWLRQFPDTERIRNEAAHRPRFPDLKAVHRHLRAKGVL